MITNEQRKDLEDMLKDALANASIPEAHREEELRCVLLIQQIFVSDATERAEITRQKADDQRWATEIARCEAEIRRR